MKNSKRERERERKKEKKRERDEIANVKFWYKLRLHEQFERKKEEDEDEDVEKFKRKAADTQPEKTNSTRRGRGGSNGRVEAKFSLKNRRNVIQPSSRKWIKFIVKKRVCRFVVSLFEKCGSKKQTKQERVERKCGRQKSFSIIWFENVCVN